MAPKSPKFSSLRGVSDCLYIHNQYKKTKISFSFSFTTITGSSTIVLLDDNDKYIAISFSEGERKNPGVSPYFFFNVQIFEQKIL